MGRVDGFGAELLPDCRVIQKAINEIRGRALVVQIGAGNPLFKLEGIDIDLVGKTTIPELLDIASHADAFVGYPSFVVPLAEALNKPSLIVWSRRGLNARDPFISRITPAKILHKPSSRFVIDDCADEQLRKTVDEIL
jgi:ADP-heptose:LPS heptosyltransferase